MRIARAAVVFGACLVATSAVNGNEPLRVQISPTIVRAPAFVTVRVSVEADADNRLLRVVAESGDFYRSSEVELQGISASPLNVFEFRELPPGLYQVTSVLVGTHGTRATSVRLAKVERSPGGDR